MKPSKSAQDMKFDIFQTLEFYEYAIPLISNRKNFKY